MHDHITDRVAVIVEGREWLEKNGGFTLPRHPHGKSAGGKDGTPFCDATTQIKPVSMYRHNDVFHPDRGGVVVPALECGYCGWREAIDKLVQA